MSRKLSSVFNLCIKKSTISEFALPLVCIVHRSKKAGRLLYASTFLANSALFAMKSDHYNRFSFGLIKADAFVEFEKSGLSVYVIVEYWFQSFWPI